MNALLPSEDNARADVQSGEYERYYKIQPGNRVLDLGAHVGYFTQHAINRVGDTGFVVAFEPEKTNFERLATRIVANAHTLIIPAGASDVDAEELLWINKENSGAHSFFKYHFAMESQECRLCDIGKWCTERNFFPDFCKIDTEGSEAVILKSLFRSKLRPHIAFEAHSEQLWEECRELLISNSYKAIPGGCVVGVNWGVPV